VAQRADAVKGAVRARGVPALRLFLALGVAAALGYGGWRTWLWATHAPTFALKTVTFSGVHRARTDDLVRMGGLAKGENLFLLDPLQIERGMAGHPWVRKVSLTRHFPSAVAIRIEEHVPSAIAALGDLYLLDEDGAPFKKVEPSDKVDLPLVTGVDREAYLQDPKAAAKRTREALAAMRAYAAQPGAEGELSEVHVEDEGLTLVTLDGVRIRVGGGELDSSLKRLARVRAERHARGLVADVIHLENRKRPGWVAIKLSTPDSERSKGRK
jgi:cell division protein FtsQ